MNLFSKGARRPSSVFDAAAQISAHQQKKEQHDMTETAFFESVSDDQMLESLQKAAITNVRADGAAAVVSWVEEGDSDLDSLDSIAFGLAGGDDDDELDDIGVEQFGDVMDAAAEFIVSVGVEPQLVESMFNGDDDAADTVFDQLDTVFGGEDTDDMIASFAVKEQMMMESVKKVIRDGEVVLVRKNKRKKRLTAAQRAALKKARMKAHTSAAKAARKKSMKLRKSRGLK